jgi:DNA-binding transcriptional MerR regulator
MAEYKIKDLEVLTGVKAHTIRIWEKRYGLVAPLRTETKIRTYNDEDLVFLLNVSLLNKKGYKISKIADFSKEQLNKKVMEVMGNESSDTSHEQLILALIELDEALFKRTVEELIALHGMENTFTKHLIPFLDRIGVMWLVGTITAAQEHFISNLIRQKIITETDKLTVPVKRTNPLMLFLPEHEWHELSLLFYQYILRRRGIDTLYLGQSLPYDSLKETVEKFQPSALITSWLTAVDEKFIVSFFANLKKTFPELPVFAGGYQIKTHVLALKGLINEIENVDTLTTNIN